MKTLLFFGLIYILTGVILGLFTTVEAKGSLSKKTWLIIIFLWLPVVIEIIFKKFKK